MGFCLGSPCHRQLLMAVPPALLPYVPRVPPGALLGKVTATTFALERPCCVFDRLANTSDAVWLVVAFANASATFRNPPSRADVPLYEGLPTAHAYMTLETAAAAYACSAPGPTVLRVGGDTACGGQHGQAACNGPLPSPGPYRTGRYPRACVVPVLVVPVLQGEVPGDGLPRPQSGDKVVRPHPPAERYRWERGWRSVAFPLHPVGCGITSVPPPQTPEGRRGSQALLLTLFQGAPHPPLVSLTPCPSSPQPEHR
uniref:Uroplakin 3B n=1 Tax=Anser cygnoides TaxID=8845 RepID=A0A8B9IQA3_ANSCY